MTINPAIAALREKTQQEIDSVSQELSRDLPTERLRAYLQGRLDAALSIQREIGEKRVITLADLTEEQRKDHIGGWVDSEHGVATVAGYRDEEMGLPILEVPTKNEGWKKFICCTSSEVFPIYYAFYPECLTTEKGNQ
ncbi:hypothetical protein [uncultured Corynebacterium sp.]|uniref:hypothetical protein n=1 Tax=uncultured Corynebacterium sp. TaxID=159447 RepID=UPI0025983A27|nr:hypothetical protein [uncultured Corynebacterium sp.]